MKDILIARDTKGKIRVLNFECVRTETDAGDLYIIYRSSGQLNGKMTSQPNLEICKGKVKRTVQQQAELEYNALIKKALDKGYKNISDFNCKSISEITDSTLPIERTDQNGSLKPMLCKVFDFHDAKLTNVPFWFISKKLDGVRCFLFIKDGEIVTSSRGGQDYNIPTTYIRKDPFIERFFKENPNAILDGEIYRHGWNLSTISGLCRLETLEERHKELSFYCYDIVDETKPFIDRLAILQNLYKETLYTDSKLIIVEHTKVLYNQIMEYHNKFVQEGFEGAVVRDPTALYKCGARDRRMCKIKIFSDAEFKILGLAEGLRDEDLCFVLETANGDQFKAKPIGSREDKKWYRENIDSLIGKMGTVKYFGMTNTEHPVPNLPVFKSVRLTKDV